jgi:drug/metabolite transporter (DMT)-like permease
MKDGNNKRLIAGHLAACGAYLIFGFNIVLTKDLTNSHIFTPLSLFTLRSVGAGLLFWILSFFYPKETVEKKDLVKIFFASLLGYYGTQLTFLVGINYTTPLDCSIIATFSPVFTMLVAAIVLKEPITTKKALGVAISFAGIILLIYNSSIATAETVRTTTPLGIILILLNSLLFASYLGIFRPVIQKYSVVTFMKWIFLFSFAMSAPFSFSDLMDVDYASVPTACFLELAYLVFFCNIHSLLPDSYRTKGTSPDIGQSVFLYATYRRHFFGHIPWNGPFVSDENHFLRCCRDRCGTCQQIKI